MFSLDQVVPWGRSYQEYRLMFALSEEDLRLRILGCADGPASSHHHAILELCRVAKEVRIFPLIGLDGSPSRHVSGIVETLRSRYECAWKRYRTSFNAVGNQMMTVQPAANPASNATSLE